MNRNLKFTTLAVVSLMSASAFAMKTETTDFAGAGKITVKVTAIDMATKSTEVTVATVKAETSTTAMSFAEIKAIYGVMDGLDAELVLPSYASLSNSVKVGTAAATETSVSGITDTHVRAKYSLLKGEMNLAVLPFITLPTQSTDLGSTSIGGGVAVPFSMNLPAELKLGATATAGMAKSASYNLYLSGSANVGRALTKDIGVFGEVFARKSMETGSKSEMSAGLGGTYQINEMIGTEFCFHYGLTDATPTLQPMFLVSAKF